ncbi:hypothetical protein DDB_G0288353 [Dictyostelium discoideum AX4]|uniref:Putative uncharacterized transmembrane protein DDB_G0288353 n=1 Tax=Dictyostelium discoideum TaxID=44689 RepID=Y7905_DICDI|nr:hypothetical protein DDB_G0288353 [Dictyostelium discoideum AX4]Q54J19.1 RecName: Full=Putative uncharacterized transmembrane protein DDB_G0288353 [Dictyostelium discoideum]EAL63273.1 hypothetical protein DDB_G0288353 [Dictyostelium discoideum AX4]|eukprot:XP_636782.1 hypothetical protein DDB_G0288353 [Dictyostelium discoideum AX4]
MVIPNLHNSIPICGKCDPKLTNSFIGIVLFLAVLIIGILILILFYYNKEINKNSSQYLPIHSPGSGNPSPSSSFLINNNNNNNNYHQNNNSNNNNIIYNPYYNSSTTSPYYLSPNSNHNPSLILYHQSRLLGNIHSINSINNNNNNNNNNPPTNISNKLNKNGETKNI